MQQIQIEQLWKYISSWYNHNRKLVNALIIGFLLLIGVGIYLYFASIYKEQSAHQALSEVLIEYDRAHISPELWSDVEFGGKTGAKQFPSSAAAPYFIFLQAEALIQANNLDEALEVMKQGMKKLSKKSPVYSFFALKLARLKMSIDDQATRQEGLEELQVAAQDKSALSQDQALYYLAEYYQLQGQVQESMHIWEQLAGMEQEKLPSPWVLAAREKISKGSRE